MAVNAPIRNIPEVFNWIQVWGLWRPVNSISTIIIHKLPTHSLSCTRRNPGPTPAALCLTVALRNSSQYLTAVNLPLDSTFLWPSQVYYSADHPPPNWSYWMTLLAAEHSLWHIQTISLLSHVLSVNLLSREWGTSGGPANSGVLWQMPIELHNAGLWAQVWLEDVRLPCHPYEIWFWQFNQKHAHQ